MRIVRSLRFRIDACPGSPLLKKSPMAKRDPEGACEYDPAVHEFRKKLARRFGLSLKEGWAAAALDARLTPLLDHVRELTADGHARFGEGVVTETLAPDEPFDWYRLAPGRDFTPRHRKDGATQLLGEYEGVFATTAFRGAVESAGLRGLAFALVYAEPTRDDPRAWYTCVATNLLGRGLDHPWAPPYAPDTLDGPTRLASKYAENDTAIRDRLDPQVRAVCDAFPPGRLRLAGFDRQLAESLPAADFACRPIVDGGGRWYGSGVYVSRRAAAALLDAGVLRASDLEPIEVVREEDADVPVLDRTEGPLPQSLRDAVAARKSVPVIGEPQQPRLGPRSRLPLEEVVARVKEKVEVFEPVGEEEIDAAAAAAGVRVPRVWRLVLTKLGRAALADFLPYPPADWVTFQPDHDALADADPTLPRRMLAVGSSGCGDWYSLDLEHVTDDGDCPCLKFDHETNRCVDRWDSVSAYLHQALLLSP